MDRFTKAIEQARGRNPQQDAMLLSRVANTLELNNEALASNQIVSHDLTNQASDAFRLLKTRVDQRMKKNAWCTMGVTSTAPKAGKTTTAVNLAITMALDLNEPVVLVDTDLRNPSVANALGLGPLEKNLVTYLKTDGAEIFDYLYATSIKNLFVLPTEKILTSPSEALTSGRMKNLLSELKGIKPCTLIFDLPPILVGDDVMAFSSLIDAVLLVIENGKTKSGELEDCLGMLDEVPILGTVLNRLDSSSYVGTYGDY